MEPSMLLHHAGEARRAADEAAAPESAGLDALWIAEAAAVPDEFCELMTLCGPEGDVRDRVEAFREAGATMLDVTPVGPEPARLIETVENWL